MTSRYSSTPWSRILAINIGSMGEMPPSTRSTYGFSAATACAAIVIMCAKICQSGSSSKAQCDLLLGSFQNIIASIMVLLPQAGFRPGRIDGARPVRQFLTAANKHFFLGMTDDLKTSTAQEGLGAGPIRDPVVGGIASIRLFEKVQAGKTGLVENIGFPKRVIGCHRYHLVAATLHRLEHQQVPSHVLMNQVEGQQGMTQVVQDAHEQHEIEGFTELGHVVYRELMQFELHPADLGRKARLRQIQGLAINPYHACSATPFHLNSVEPAIAANIEDRLAVQVGWQGIGKTLP